MGNDVEKELEVEGEEEIEEMQSSLAIGSDLEKEESSEFPSDPENVYGADQRPTVSRHTTQHTQNSVHPAHRVVTAQDWTGPDDPENPRNWPAWKRVWHSVPPGLFAFTVTFGSSVYTPGYHEVAERFDVSPTAALLGLSLYVLGLAFGPMLAAPLSETYGRHHVSHFALPISMLFTLGAGFSQTFAALLACRFFAGFFGSPVLAVGMGTIADLFPPDMIAPATSFFLMAPFLGPCLGPVIGGFAAESKGWRWTQWCMLFFSLAIFLLGIPTEETYKKAILKRRAKRLGLPPPPKLGSSRFDALRIIITVTLIRPVHMLLFEPLVGFISLYTAFTFAVLFVFFAAIPYTFTKVYHFSTYQNGLVFVAVGVGVCIAVITTIFCDRVIYMRLHRKAISEGRRQAHPEHRLYSAMIGSLGVPIGLFWFGWTAREGVHWIVPIIGTVPFAWGNLSIFIAACLYLIDVYGPLNGASSMAANGLARYALGGAFPLFTVQMYNKLGIDWATSLLAFIAVAMLPIPWIFYKWGPQIRRKSYYNTLKD